MTGNATPIEYRDIIIPKATIDRILKHTDCPLKALGLYVFYYYTAIWQKTNCPRCTTSYTAKAMGCSEALVRIIKKQLMDMGLLEDVTTKDAKTGQIACHYLRVFYYQSSHTHDLLECGKGHSVGLRETNAYSTDRLNAYSTGTVGADKASPRHALILSHSPKKPTTAQVLAHTLYDILAKHHKIMRRPELTTWGREFTQLLQDVDANEIRQTLDWYAEHLQNTYTPKAYSAAAFRRKYINIRDQIDAERADRQRERKRLAESDDPAEREQASTLRVIKRKRHVIMESDVPEGVDRFPDDYRM